MSEFGDRLAAAFAELVDLPVDARRSRLETLAGVAPELADEVESLLRAHEADKGFLSPPDAIALANLLEDDDRDQMPTSAGNWTLTRELGRGGLGVVYLAERAGDGYEQKAAVKLIKRGMDSDAILRRFHNERRILASLDHPNIARLIDGGVLEDGRPWFAMEYVDGLRITDWCDQNMLTLQARLGLFQQIARAVQAAHARLIVHRDLKPSNILVNADGQVKLLDFGIAKLLDTDLAHSAELTRIGAVAMTPEYAAPEQIAGRPISVVTDVYALGVVLFELLCGRHPYRDEAQTLESLQRAVRNADPTAPSTLAGRLAEGHPLTRTVRPAALRKQLRGDLDAIVLTAMARDPEQRYPSVESLAEDIQRHLDELPVRARARSRTYRFGRFLRRYRTAVSAVAAVMAALALGLGIAIWQAREAREQAFVAEQARQRAVAVSDFLAHVLSSPRPTQLGPNLPISAVLDDALGNVDSFFEGQPEARADVLTSIGHSFMQLQEYDKARPALTRAMGLFREQNNAVSAGFAQLLMADLHQVQGELAKARTLYRDILSNLPDQEEGVAALKLSSRIGLIRADINSGELEGVDTALDSAFAFSDAAGLTDHSNEWARLSLILGQFRMQSGDFYAARAPLENAVDFFLSNFGERNSNTVAARNSLVESLVRTGALAEAASLAHRNHQVVSAWLAPEDRWRSATSDTLANILSSQGLPEQALVLNEEALLAYAAEADIDPLRRLHLETNRLAYLLEAGRAAEALRLADRLLPELDQRLGPTHPTCLITRLNRADALLALDQLDASLMLASAMRGDLIERFGQRHLFSLVAAYLEGASLSRQGRYEDGEELLQMSFDGLTEQLGPSDPLTLKAALFLATHFRDVGEHSLSREIAEAARQQSRQRLGSEHKRTHDLQALLHSLPD
ncbi:MAG: serine/threonine-protein kinase [Wenzhouxiangella sp.]|jgi:serine/threonine-protein kinase|nr:serine/threonine-protein kinase [Wenzhouxiangella sp.]